MASTNRRKPLLVLLAVAGGLFVLIQAVPYGRAHTNPPVTAEPAWNSPRTQELFYRACGDCHSNKTVWPWYSNVAPASWLVQRDVDKGRRHMNVSQWKAGKNYGLEAAGLIDEGKMPLPPYLLLHPEARLTPAEKQELMDGVMASLGMGEDKKGRRDKDGHEKEEREKEEKH
ncbi:MAG: heme-binding domain-containing protein [Acidobacteria bacterium]|nr:heme-binding domain-containing protein [Acidobacteriota bacterium]